MITLVKGTDPRLVVVLQQRENDSSIMPLNITNTMQVSVVYKDLIGTKVKNASSGVDIVDAIYGKIFINFTDAETDKLRLGNFDFDVHVDEGATKLIWKFDGRIQVVDRIR